MQKLRPNVTLYLFGVLLVIIANVMMDNIVINAVYSICIGLFLAIILLTLIAFLEELFNLKHIPKYYEDETDNHMFWILTRQAIVISMISIGYYYNDLGALHSGVFFEIVWVLCNTLGFIKNQYYKPRKCS
ncbi:hypothetical protein PBI_SCTP2_510 [Salicola phage SCTP-2]|nr:hypothetical protein PBI_SCTP2_510 [Salicola phage SCTP-2]